MAKNPIVEPEIEDLLKNLTEAKSNKKNYFAIGEINESISNEIIRELVDIDWDNETDKEINLYICSQGGFLSDCFALIDLIIDYKKTKSIKVNTYGLGEVASAGFFLFLLGDNRYLYPSCRVFVHSHITVTNDLTYEERIKADKHEEKDTYNNYLRFIAEQLNISSRKAKTLLKKSKWLNKKEIITYNINTGDKNE